MGDGSVSRRPVEQITGGGKVIITEPAPEKDLVHHGGVCLFACAGLCDTVAVWRYRIVLFSLPAFAEVRARQLANGSGGVVRSQPWCRGGRCQDTDPRMRK